LVADVEALAERIAPVLVAITVMVFPFQFNIRSLPSVRALAASKGDNGGVREAFSPDVDFFRKGCESAGPEKPLRGRIVRAMRAD
jgi:hypothetical protein